jgi:hypothetical protein
VSRKQKPLRHYVPFEETLSRITTAAIEATQQEIALAFDVRFGSPTQQMIGELGLYARHLATWTCDEEEFGNVRPLRDLLADAALTITIQANLGTAAIASAAETPDPSHATPSPEAANG